MIHLNDPLHLGCLMVSSAYQSISFTSLRLTGQHHPELRARASLAAVDRCARRHACKPSKNGEPSLLEENQIMTLRSLVGWSVALPTTAAVEAVAAAVVLAAAVVVVAAAASAC